MSESALIFTWRCLALPSLCPPDPAGRTFCHLRRRALRPVSYGQEICGGKCKIFSYRQEIGRLFLLTTYLASALVLEG